MTRRLPILLGSLAFASLVGTAEAGHAHFSGSVHVGGGGGGVHFGGGGSVHWSSGGYAYRPSYGGGWGVHGHIYVGPRYNPYWGYRPYYYYYGPEYVPSYYGGGSYYPVEPSAAAVAAPGVVAVAPPELPRFGIGLFGGAVKSDLNTQMDTKETDFGLIGRLRLTPGLLVEGELGKTSYNVNGQDNVRVDRRLGGSLIYEIGAYNSLAPYVLGGLGVQQADVNGSYSTTQDFAEIGAGLRYAITPHFHLTFDVRAGSRSTVSQDKTIPTGTVARSVAPSSNQNEDYTRGRLTAILYF